MSGTEYLSFKAGRMTAIAKEGKNWEVEADPRKGRLVLLGSQDGMTHLLWKTRPGNQVEEDFLVFPDNQEFSKVDTGRSGDRVFLLQFKNSSNRAFFWMQESKKEKDEENCRLLNEYMTNPPPAGMGDLGGEDGQNELMNLLSQLQGNAGGRPIQIGDLSNVLQEMNMPQSGSGSGGSGDSSGRSSSRRNRRGGNSESKDGADDAEDGEDDDSGEQGATGSGAQGQAEQPTPAPQQGQGGAAGGGGASQLTADDFQRAFSQLEGAMGAPTPSLAHVYNSSVMQELLQDHSVRDRLIGLLPDEQQSVDELYHIISSPQIRQAFSVLSHALQSDNFNTVMSNFGLNLMDGAAHLQRGDGIGAFLSAIQADADRGSSSSNDNGGGDGDGGDDFYN